MTVKTVETKKLNLKTREQLNQQGNTGSERNEIRARRQVEKDEDGIVFDRDALMDKSNGGRACSRTAGARRGYRGDGYKPQQMDRGLTQGKKTWTERDEALKRSEGSRPVERKLTEARKGLAPRRGESGS